MTSLRRAAVIATAGMALVGAGQVPATAAVQFAPDKFRVCLSPSNCGIRVEGTIVWGQRTATITGTIYNNDSADAQAHAEWFAEPYGGAADHATYSTHLYEKAYTVNIGDPNRRGGINKIFTKVCWVGYRDSKCSTEWLDIRD